METAPDSRDSLTLLVGVAVHSDDSARLVADASLRARCPLALVGQHGEPLGHAPEGTEGRRALAVARAAAHNRLVDAAGWSIVPIRRGPSLLGFLVIGTRRENDAATRVLLDVLPELVAEQLQRVALQRAQRAAFVRRLLSDRRFGAAEARREALSLGVDLAEAYWPAILTWHGITPPASVAEDLARDALSLADGSLTAVLSRRIVLLHPRRAADDDDARQLDWMREIVRRARKLAPSFPAQAIVGEAAVELGAVSAGVAELDALRRLGPRVEGERLLVSAREYALERLFWDNLDGSAARRFVDEQLGPLIDWDREHRTDLLTVLEAELDFPRHDQAARSCFMHRNTFRHRVHQAREVLGDTLEDPDVRLAMHVALKLRRLLAGPSLDGTAAP
ncbi:MAG: helix-turn-helix domain-containing protein, partial [Actinomycetota bacterium]|nr:helix-turn-helix domain-containing protein [Actinomycetota bacterium]